MHEADRISTEHLLQVQTRIERGMSVGSTGASHRQALSLCRKGGVYEGFCCLMLTCESTPKNKKSGCPSNKAVIAKRMKGHSLANLKQNSSSRPNGQVGEKTSKRAELAKIAGTSQGSIQRTKLILEKDDRPPISFHSSL